MLYLNIRSMSNSTFFQKIKNNFHSLFTRSKVDHQHILLEISSENIRLSLINNFLIEEDETFDIYSLNLLLETLKKFKNTPVYCLLKDCDTTIKQLNLKGANVFDRYFAQYHFKRCEFQDTDLVYCLPSYNAPDVYIFYSIQNTVALQKIIAELSAIPNDLIGIEQEEHILLKTVVPSSSIAEKRGHILFLKTDDSWKIIVSLGQDLILCRHGVYDNHHNFVQEIMQTIQYLTRIDFNINLPMTVYAEKNIFSRIILAQNRLELVECENIEKGLYSYPEENLVSIVFKKVRSLNFINQKLYFKSLLKNRFFYEFPRLSFSFLKILIPLFILSMMINGARYFYYDQENKHIEDLICQKTAGWDKKKSLVDADQYLDFYQKNPVLLMKSLSTVIPPYLTAEKVSFNNVGDTLSIRFKIVKKQKEDVVSTLKNLFEQHFPSSTIDIKMIKNDIISFKMVQKK